MTREKKIQHLIEKVILTKFPFLVNVVVTDLFDGDPYFDNMGGYSYVAEFETDKCLSSEEMEMVDTDVKVLFRMMSIINQSKNMDKKETEIRCFFDCGDGEGFNFSGSFGYKH